jgi:hypothetical protein
MEYKRNQNLESLKNLFSWNSLHPSPDKFTKGKKKEPMRFKIFFFFSVSSEKQKGDHNLAFENTIAVWQIEIPLKKGLGAQLIVDFVPFHLPPPLELIDTILE